MPSLIPDYEYDIFISYRQKDNLRLSSHGTHLKEGWVTEFVAHLKRELEVTFKEQISVYIDENIHDGIREVHEVSESLTTKLKCVVFIPIISQTYCDPKSYAWNNEFLIFKQMALTDNVGLKVKLQNGNVISRIIPVRIHELDVQDGLLLMKELGGPLRSIDFIFRTPGVNRPLRAHEDHPNDNRDKTYYHDQINKVANSIKEIFVSLQAPPKTGSRTGNTRTFAPLRATGIKRWVVAAFVVGLTMLAGFSWYQNYFERRTKMDSDRISIAVIPFKSIDEEDESKKFADAVTSVIVSNLIMFPELKVKSRLSVEKYRNQPKTVPEIAAELGVDYILVGNTQKVGDNIRIIVELVDASSDVNVWTEQFNRKLENIFETQSQISVSIAKSLKAKLTPAIAEKIKQAPTSFEAYDRFLRAKQWVNRYSNSQDVADLDYAIDLLKASIRLDPQFATSYAWLAGVMAAKEAVTESYSGELATDSVLFFARKALEIDSTVVEAYMILSERYHHYKDDVNDLRYTNKALDHIENIQFTVGNAGGDTVVVAQLMKRIASAYARIGDTDRAANLYDQIWKLDTMDIEVLHEKFYPLASGKQVDKLITLSNQIKNIYEEDPFIEVIMTHIYLEKFDVKNLERLYREKENELTQQMNSFDQYILVYATALRKNGKEKEAIGVARKFQRQLLEGGSYLEAQLLIFNGHTEDGLKLLESVDIGWYNLNLCLINPVFEPVKNDTRFRNFIKRNNDRIREASDRIFQLERDGYLKHPEDILEQLFFRKKSELRLVEPDTSEPRS